MKRVYGDYIEDIIRSITYAHSFIKGIDFDKFIKDNKTIFAVIRALEIIGEAANKLPDTIKCKYSDIPWKSMTTMRNKLIHEYFGVDLRVVWNTINIDLSGLIDKLKPILNDLDNNNI